MRVQFVFVASLIGAALAAPVPVDVRVVAIARESATAAWKRAADWRRDPEAQPADWKREAEAQPAADWRRDGGGGGGNSDWRREANGEPLPVSPEWEREAEPEPVAAPPWKRS